MTIEQMAANARTEAKARAGAGWSLLGEELQEALVARETLALISANQENDGWQRAGLLAQTVLVAKLAA